MSAEDVDLAFEQWRAAPPEEKESAQARLVSFSEDFARRICHTILGDDPADIVNEAIRRMLMRVHTYQGDSRFSTWFYSVARSAILDGRKTIIRQKNGGMTGWYASRNVKMQQLDGYEKTSAFNDGETRILMDDIWKNLPPVWQIRLAKFLSGEELPSVYVRGLKQEVRKILYGEDVRR